MFYLQVGVAYAKYKNRGHKKSLTPVQATQVVDFVKHWRAKVFCICRHVRAELKLKVSLATISRTLNRHISFVVLAWANYNRSAKGKRRAKNYNRSAKGKRRAKRWNDKRYSLRHES